MSKTPFRKVHTPARIERERERERKYKKWHQVGSVCGMRRARSERARERSSLRVGKRRRVPCTWIKGQVDQFTCCQSDQHLASCARQPLHVQLMLSNSHHSYSTCSGYIFPYRHFPGSCVKVIIIIGSVLVLSGICTYSLLNSQWYTINNIEFSFQ
jgi:hypothetical protein